MSVYFKAKDEEIWEFHKRLMRNYGCDHCSELGNNGCGVAFIDGYCFSPGMCEPGESMESGYDDICTRRKFQMREHVEMRMLAVEENAERPVKAAHDEFQCYIAAALEYAPDGMSPDVYGELVRSAAAVYCHRSGDESRPAAR